MTQQGLTNVIANQQTLNEEIHLLATIVIYILLLDAVIHVSNKSGKQPLFGCLPDSRLSSTST